MAEDVWLLQPPARARREVSLCEAMPRKAQKKTAPTKPFKKASNGQHLKRFSVEFLADVAATCQLPTNDVRTVLEGLRKVLLNQIRDKSTTKIPNIALLRIKTLKARPATKKLLFGVEKEVRAKPESKKVLCTALKAFQVDCRD